MEEEDYQERIHGLFILGHPCQLLDEAERGCAYDEWDKAGIDEVDAGTKDGVCVWEYQGPREGLEGVSGNENPGVGASYYGR